ncbi:MAG: cyclic nucleotide-binding domain-containing protein, partial [Actinomycetota bacterium]|nr:cyclic nucleotide-binding domain-containing protein [Actinomycetota bacterium]
AKAALTPSLARTPVELTAANVAATTTESAGSFVGPALGGMVLAVADVEAALAATAAAFLISAVLVARIRSGETPAPAPAASLAGDLLGGVRAIRDASGVPLLVGLYGAQTLVAGMLNVLIVVLALDLLALGEPAVGYLDGVIGVGGIAATVVVLARAGRARLGLDFAIGLLLWGLPLAAIGVWPETAFAIPMLAAVGVGNTIVDVAAVTLLQRAAPEAALARVFGVLESLTWATIGLGALAAPLAVELLGERSAFVATGLFLPVLGVLSWRRLASLDASLPPPDERLEATRAVPLFAALAPEALEQVAAALVPVRFAAGEAIVRQGERGDRFFLIRRGAATVSVDGRQGQPLAPGDFFGEIALLRGVPRTATVRAIGDLDAYAVDAATFAAAVGGSPGARATAERAVRTRLRTLRPSGASL